MKTTIEIDNKLILKAISLNPGFSKSEIVKKALQLYVAIENQKKLLDFYGKIKLDDQAFL